MSFVEKGGPLVFMIRELLAVFRKIHISGVFLQSFWSYFQLFKKSRILDLSKCLCKYTVDSVISACPARFRLLDRVTNFKPVFFFNSSSKLTKNSFILPFCSKTLNMTFSCCAKQFS